MANRKRRGRPPQAQHGAKSKSSQHDKRQRLKTPNPERQSTDAASVPLVGGIAALGAAMSGLLDKRIAAAFLGPFSGHGFESPWINSPNNDTTDKLTEILGSSSLARFLRRIRVGEYGLEDVEPGDFDSYIEGLRSGLKDALRGRQK